MDAQGNVLEVQRSERADHANDLVVVGDWQVREMRMDLFQLRELWERLQQYPTLFTDITRGDAELFWQVISAPDSFWMEVWRADKLEGVMYLTNIQPGIDAQVHPIFFNRSVADKIDICMATIRWIFATFRFHRLTAVMPHMFFLASRLARKVGFEVEGRRKQVYFIGGRWVDELILGLLASRFSEIENVRVQ